MIVRECVYVCEREGAHDSRNISHGGIGEELHTHTHTHTHTNVGVEKYG
jgi:hypothetical protein